MAMPNFKELLPGVKAFAFDVDGVFSGNIYITNSGEQLRSMNIKDGYALQLAIKKGFPVAIITGGQSDAIKHRFEGLGVTDIYMKSSCKIDDYKDFLFKYDLKPEEVMYMGDDIPDFEVMKKTGVPVCPADAAEEIKSLSLYISHVKGGEGCVRDVIEQVLRAQNLWMDSQAFHW
jgi:3-deoxy-D-manno-octulosonate 8-phosphate phosphatase (KDO 8-P phosphatase)